VSPSTPVVISATETLHADHNVKVFHLQSLAER
jgi:hypothetical protein